MVKPANSYLNGRTKRLLDIVGSLFGLIFGLPFFLFAIIIIALVDQVPVIFTQKRLGIKGKAFNIRKLRTLKVVETSEMINPQNIMHESPYPPTMTGRLWRRSSIDEIIQFWLVLSGKMSLIGPRPIPMDFLPHLPDLDGLNKEFVESYLKKMYNVKPGMSGLSSTEGRALLKMKDKMVFDVKYAESASLKVDLKLMIKTIYVVFSRKGAI